MKILMIVLLAMLALGFVLLLVGKGDLFFNVMIFICLAVMLVMSAGLI